MPATATIKLVCSQKNPKVYNYNEARNMFNTDGTLAVAMVAIQGSGHYQECRLYQLLAPKGTMTFTFHLLAPNR